MGNKSLQYSKSVNNNNENKRNGYSHQYLKRKKNALSEPSLFGAIDDNDCERIKQLVKSGHNINKVDINGLTPLHCAAINGSEECVKLLIEFGSQLRSCSLRITSLHFAAQNGNENMINMLIDYGEVVNTMDMMGDTPLSSAVQVNNIETSIALLKRGAVLKPHVLVSAIEYGFNDLLRQLINNYGSDIISSIDLSNFRFTRVCLLGLQILYFAGFKFSDSFRTETKPLNWSDFCLSGQIRLPPVHYNQEEDSRAFQLLCLWLDERQRQPVSLKCLSRIAFRRACHQNSINTVLTNIKLPVIINNYLLLNDIH